MLTACLVEPGTIEVREVPDPEPDRGEVVVRVERALTCGTDLKAYRRGHPFIPMPGPFGHQFSGSIAAVGADVDGFAAGDEIWGVLSAPCGACELCARGRESMCEELKSEIFFAAFAQYLRLPPRVVEKNLLARPPDVDALTGAFLEPVSCVVHALDQLDLRDVRRALVLGLGSMGLLFCQLLRRSTTGAVVGAGRRDERLAVANRYGLDGVIDLGRGDPGAHLASAGPFDCVIECTGRMEGWETALRTVAPGGQVLLFGGLSKGTTIPVDTYRLHYEEISIHGCFHFGPRDVRRAAEWIARHELDLHSLVSGERSLEGLEDALDAMANGRGIKYAIRPWVAD